MSTSAADRYLLLSQLLDELPEDDAGELCRAVTMAGMAVVRNVQGRATDAEARFAVERAADRMRAYVRGIA